MATSVFIVAITALISSVGHAIGFIQEGGDVLNTVLSLVIFTEPGVIIGAQLGSLVASRIPQKLLERGMGILFILVGILVGEPPNNWRSYFGGSGWTFNEQRQQYYFHSFNQNQPDLNWRNPDVKQAVYDIIRFWLDKGVDGFRLDASSVYSQDKYFRNNPLKFEATDTVKYRNYHHLYTRDLPENHDIIREIL